MPKLGTLADVRKRAGKLGLQNPKLRGGLTIDGKTRGKKSFVPKILKGIKPVRFGPKVV